MTSKYWLTNHLWVSVKEEKSIPLVHLRAVVSELMGGNGAFLSVAIISPPSSHQPSPCWYPNVTLYTEELKIVLKLPFQILHACKCLLLAELSGVLLGLVESVP